MCRRGELPDADGELHLLELSWPAHGTAAPGSLWTCSGWYVGALGERREQGVECARQGSGELSPMVFGQRGCRGGLGCSSWLGWVVERGQREGGQEGRGLASEWRGECPPLARGGERGEMSREEGWCGVGVSLACGAMWVSARGCLSSVRRIVRGVL